MSYFKKQQNGVLFLVYVQPGAKSQEITGLHGERVKIRIQAPPTDNLANEQVLSFLADFFGLPKVGVQLLRGAKNRRKDILLTDIDIETLESKLKPALG